MVLAAWAKLARQSGAQVNRPSEGERSEPEWPIDLGKTAEAS